jgi:integrase
MRFYKRKNSPFYYVDVEGKRISTRAVTKKEAIAFVKKLQTEAELSEAPITRERCVTLADIAELYARQLWSNHKSWDSFYSVMIKALLKDDITKIAIEKLTVSALLEWVDIKLKEGNARSTVNQKLSIIKALIDRHRSLANAVPHLDFDAVKLRKAEKRHEVYFNKPMLARIDKFLENSGREDVKFLFNFLTDTGCRISNALLLTWADIEFTEEYVIFRDTKTTPYAVPMTERCRIELQRRKALGWVTPFNGLTYNAVRLCFGRMRSAFGKEAGSGFKIHAFRRTAGTQLLQAGVDVRVVQKFLNHTNIAMTARYAIVPDSSLKAALEKLEKKK